MRDGGAVAIGDFLRVRSASGLRFSPGGGRVAFALQWPDLEINGYRARLAVWERGSAAIRELPAPFKPPHLLWLDEDRILHSAEPDGELKARVEAGEAWTSFGVFDLRDGSERAAFSLPHNVKKLLRTDSGSYVYLAVHQPAAAAASERSWEESVAVDSGEPPAAGSQALKAGKDFEIIDDLPIWADGAGFLRGRVGRLYLLREGGSPVPLTGEDLNVEMFRLRGEELIYVAKRAGDFMESSGIFVHDLASGTARELLPQNRFAVAHADFLDGVPIFLGVGRDGGLRTDNPKFYRIEDGEVRLWADTDFSVRDTVGYDCKYGESAGFKVEGGFLYFVTTREKSSFLARMDAGGAVELLTPEVGAVQDFDVRGDAAVFSGLVGMGLQELYLLEGGLSRRISETNAAALEGKRVSTAETMVFRNHGSEVHYVVLKPADFDPGSKYPAVLYIHGGAKVLYGPVFFHEMQVLASRGFFVIYGNPRGSDGQGSEFARLQGKYGQMDYEDMMKAVDTALERHPQIDPERLAVAGGSYGGIMTNWIIGHTDRFRCAVSQRSLCNMISAFGTADNGYDFVREQMDADPWRDLEKLWEQSPLRYAEKVRTPLLLVHSEEDRRCHYTEAIQFFTALRCSGVEARMLFIRGETHDLSRTGRPRQRILRLTEIVNWLERHLHG